jgi:hypothetical protein
MMSSPSPWPLDSHEHLNDALREQGATAEEIADWAPVARRLGEWPEQRLSPADTQALLAALAPALPQRSAVRAAVRAHYAHRHGSLAWLLDTARAQVSILRPTFWLASAVVTLLGIYLELVSRDNASVMLLHAIGPLLAYLGIAASFRGVGLRMFESEVACPSSPLQLIIARLVIVLGYDVALGLCLSLAPWLRADHGVSFLAVTLHWLMPLLLVAGLSLVLSLRLPVAMAAGLAYGSWLAVLALYYSLPYSLMGAGALPTVPLGVEIALGLAGLALLMVGALRLPRNVSRLLPIV